MASRSPIARSPLNVAADARSTVPHAAEPPSARVQALTASTVRSGKGPGIRYRLPAFASGFGGASPGAERSSVRSSPMQRW